MSERYPVSVWICYYNDLPVCQAVELLSKAGFSYGELSICHLQELMQSGDSNGSGRQLKAFADDLGYGIPQGHLSFEGGLCDDSALERLKPEIDLFQQIGIKKAILHVGGGKELPAEQRYAQWIKYVTALSEYVRGSDITLCIENLYSVPQCRTVEQIKGIITDAGGKNLAICLDTGHLHLSMKQQVTNQTQAEFIHGAGELLQALHITDNNGVGDTHQMPYSASYGLDWKEVMQSLKDIDYKGLFNLEILGERNAPMPVKAAKLAFIRSMCDYMLSDAFLA